MKTVISPPVLAKEANVRTAAALPALFSVTVCCPILEVRMPSVSAEDEAPLAV